MTVYCVAVLVVTLINSTPFIFCLIPTIVRKSSNYCLLSTSIISISFNCYLHLQQHNSVCLQIAATMCVTNLVRKSSDGSEFEFFILILFDNSGYTSFVVGIFDCSVQFNSNIT